MTVRPLPLPRELPDGPLTLPYLIALRTRLIAHLRWHEDCCTDPNDLDTECLPCDTTEDP